MEGSLDCESCKLGKRCDDLPPTVSYVYDGIRLTVCPKVMITRKSKFLISLYSHYKSGNLFYSGGINDQPAWYLIAMQVIDSTIMEFRDRQNRIRERRTF